MSWIRSTSPASHLRSKDIRIGPEDGPVSQDGKDAHSQLRPFRNPVSAENRAPLWCLLVGKPRGGRAEPEGLLDDALEVWKLPCLGILDRGADEAGGDAIVELPVESGEGGWGGEQEQEDHSESLGNRI
jgi:hypothetical protein